MPRQGQNLDHALSLRAGGQGAVAERPRGQRHARIGVLQEAVVHSQAVPAYEAAVEQSPTIPTTTSASGRPTSRPATGRRASESLQRGAEAEARLRGRRRGAQAPAADRRLAATWRPKRARPSSAVSPGAGAVCRRARAPGWCSTVPRSCGCGAGGPSRVWHNAHGMFIPVLAGWFAWDELKRTRDWPRASSAWGFAFLVPALLIHAVDAAMNTQLGVGGLHRPAAAGAVAVVARRGAHAAHRVSAGVPRLHVADPAGLTANLHLALRHIATAASAAIVPLLGIPVYAEQHHAAHRLRDARSRRRVQRVLDALRVADASPCSPPTSVTAGRAALPSFSWPRRLPSSRTSSAWCSSCCSSTGRAPTCWRRRCTRSRGCSPSRWRCR